MKRILISPVAMYIISRILLGFGLVVCIISGSAMIGELSYPKERPIMTSLFNASWHIGSITASAIALRTVELPGDWAWRVPSLLQICPSLLQIIFVLYVSMPDLSYLTKFTNKHIASFQKAHVGW